jgi:hypothetical protein
VDLAKKWIWICRFEERKNTISWFVIFISVFGMANSVSHNFYQYDLFPLCLIFSLSWTLAFLVESRLKKRSIKGDVNTDSLHKKRKKTFSTFKTFKRVLS